MALRPPRATSRASSPLANDRFNIRNLRDVTKSLQIHFTGSKIPPTLPTESRRMLQCFIDEHDGEIELDEAARANQELRSFWDRHIAGSTSRLGAFVGVLRELRPALVDEDDILEWYQVAARPVINATGYKKAAVEDAQEFIASIMIYDQDEPNASQRERTSSRICSDLLNIYLSRTRGLKEEDQFIAPEVAQIAQQVETILVNFGKKHPRRLFHGLDDLVSKADTRLQGLTLLSAFLRHQAPHLYQVLHTPLLDNLLKCLMNDTSTTVLSVALTSLIMLLPHVPGSLGDRLPRLFLIYSRLLCWERFSALSDDAQRSLVTDDRISSSPYDHGDVGLDANWEKCRPRDDMIEAATPELKTYFTYLYGLYPLNFINYIRKPRKYLKNIDFPGADEFDLDQTVIRGRSDQFRQAHLLHPNFYSLTIEEELIDPKWPKMEAADVVADCHALAMDNHRPSLISPGPPPTGKLPALPPLPPIPHRNNGSISPAISHNSLRSGHSWRDTQSTAVDAESPILGPTDGSEHLRPRSKGADHARMSPMSIADEFPLPSTGLSGSQLGEEKQELPQTNLAYLQQELVLVRNNLNFERWHKAQYSQHIGQLTRKNVKDATVEAEHLNLLNANRALKQQLEQVRSAREATIRDSTLTRKQANNLEANMTERFNKLKKEQETWAADAEELRKLRVEMKTYRDLLSGSEARELKTSQDLEMAKRELEQVKQLEAELSETRRKVRQLEYREWDFEHAKREQEMLTSEKETLQMRVRRQEQELDRTKRMYTDRIAELEASMGSRGSFERSPTSLAMAPETSTAHAATLRELDDTKSKLVQLKKAHSKLLERFTDMELEYHSVKSQLARVQDDSEDDYGEPARTASIGAASGRASTIMSGGLPGRPGVIGSFYDVASEYGAPSDTDLTSISRSDPTPRHDRGLPVSPITPPHSEVAVDRTAGLTWKPSVARTQRSERSDNSLVYNKTAPLGADERSVASGGSDSKKTKIDPKSEVRVYGRGGAQNIKLKTKEEQQRKAEKKSGFGSRLGKGLGLGG
ncbi:Putative hamartin [Septoria linicola]|uniref:Hamartin n=1 Tax=Septoria linicola TaxID=215465 RepID=A0A9Q9B3S3_9PEZI|nr:Putative hamartin [Septoria linicola]